MEREQRLDVALKSRDLEEKQEWLRTCLNADATNEYLWEYLGKISKLLGDIIKKVKLPSGVFSQVYGFATFHALLK